MVTSWQEVVWNIPTVLFLVPLVGLLDELMFGEGEEDG